MQFFKYLGRVEGTSVLVLFFIAMPMKYGLGIPEAVRWVGLIHGILFLMYIFTGFSIAREYKWSLKTSLIGLVLSSLPFGTFYFESKYLDSPAKSA